MKKIIFFVCCMLVLVCSSVIVCKQKTTVNVGDKAPDFTLVDQNGISLSLSDMRGKKIALCFYPKDDTPGCSRQACSIQSGLEQLQENGIIVWGISTGSVASKLAFARHRALSYPQLTATKQVLDDYGVCGNWLRLWLPKRYTFLINEKGIIVAVLKEISLNNHAQQIIDEFNKVR